MLKKKTTPEEYIEQAKKVRKHHLDYLIRTSRLRSALQKPDKL